MAGEKLEGNYTRMLRVILNKSWRQHPTKHQLYGHLPHITKTIQVRRNRHAGHCWRSKDELISDVLLWTLHMAEQKQDGQFELTYSSFVRIRDVDLKTCQKRGTIGRSGERERVRYILAGGTTLLLLLLSSLLLFKTVSINFAVLHFSEPFLLVYIYIYIYIYIYMRVDW